MDYGQKVKVISGKLEGQMGYIEASLVVSGYYVVNLENGEQLGFKPEELEIIQ